MADPTYEGQARVYRKQGATEMVIATGGQLTVESGGELVIQTGATMRFEGGNLNLTSAQITMPANLALGFVQLDTFAARALSSDENIFNVNFSASGISLGSSVGGLLNAGSIPTLTMVATAGGAQVPVLTWASGQNAAIAFRPQAIPPDFSSAGGLEFHYYAERSSQTASNNTFNVKFFNGLGTSNKGTTGATLTSAPAEYTIAISSAEVGAHPGFWSFHVNPGTHTNNAVQLYTCWLEYTKRSS